MCILGDDVVLRARVKNHPVKSGILKEPFKVNISKRSPVGGNKHQQR